MFLLLFFFFFPFFFFFFFFFLFFFRYLPYFYTWCGPSANSECRSEMCCTRLAGNAGPKIANPPSGHNRTTLSGYISSHFATKACMDNRKKLVKQQYLPRMSSQYGELRPISG